MAINVVDCWTDGSGTSEGNPGGWAFVLETAHPITGQIIRKEGCGGERDTTNNRMEMTACLMGLRTLTRPCFVVVHTDSEYLMKPFTEGWLETWVKIKFHKKKNADLWMLLRETAKPHLLVWEWVKGHSKVELNERCDQLAGGERRRLIDERAEYPPVVNVSTLPRQGELGA